jgi:hypothetical protein
VTLEDKAIAVTRLYANKDFQELILGVFIDEDIHRLVMNENVASEAIQDELKGRKLLNDWLYVIIEEAEIAKTENKE